MTLRALGRRDVAAGPPDKPPTAQRRKLRLDRLATATRCTLGLTGCTHVPTMLARTGPDGPRSVAACAPACANCATKAGPA